MPVVYSLKLEIQQKPENTYINEGQQLTVPERWIVAISTATAAWKATVDDGNWKMDFSRLDSM